MLQAASEALKARSACAALQRIKCMLHMQSALWRQCSMNTELFYQFADLEMMVLQCANAFS